MTRGAGPPAVRYDLGGATRRALLRQVGLSAAMGAVVTGPVFVSAGRPGHGQSAGDDLVWGTILLTLVLAMVAWGLWQAYAWIEVDQHGITMAGWIRPRSLAWTDITDMWIRTYLGRGGSVDVLHVATTTRRRPRRIPVPYSYQGAWFSADGNDFHRIAHDLHHRWWHAAHTGRPPDLQTRQGRAARQHSRRQPHRPSPPPS